MRSRRRRAFRAREGPGRRARRTRGSRRAGLGGGGGAIWRRQARRCSVTDGAVRQQGRPPAAARPSRNSEASATAWRWLPPSGRRSTRPACRERRCPHGHQALASVVGPGEAELTRPQLARSQCTGSWSRRSDAERGPKMPSLALVDSHVVDAGLAAGHQSVLVELPQLMAVASPPLTVEVVGLDCLMRASSRTR